jgi:hypothetical protein
MAQRREHQHRHPILGAESRRDRAAPRLDRGLERTRAKVGYVGEW